MPAPGPGVVDAVVGKAVPGAGEEFATDLEIAISIAIEIGSPDHRVGVDIVD